MNNRREMYLTDRELRNLLRKRKRTIQLRKRILTLSAITFIMVFCFASIFFTFNTKAGNTSEDATLYKYYKSVQIQSNDTLWDLAKENYSVEKQSITEYIREVKQINHLEGDAIVAGNYIVLPYYSTEFVYY